MAESSRFVHITAPAPRGISALSNTPNVRASAADGEAAFLISIGCNSPFLSADIRSNLIMADCKQ
jgi:hypothetical protein